LFYVAGSAELCGWPGDAQQEPAGQYRGEPLAGQAGILRLQPRKSGEREIQVLSGISSFGGNLNVSGNLNLAGMYKKILAKNFISKLWHFLDVSLDYANAIHFYHYCYIVYMHMQRDNISCELRFAKKLTLETLNSLFWRTGDPVDGNINGFYMSRVLIRM